MELCHFITHLWNDSYSSSVVVVHVITQRHTESTCIHKGWKKLLTFVLMKLQIYWRGKLTLHLWASVVVLCRPVIEWSCSSANNRSRRLGIVSVCYVSVFYHVTTLLILNNSTVPSFSKVILGTCRLILIQLVPPHWSIACSKNQLIQVDAVCWHNLASSTNQWQLDIIWNFWWSKLKGGTEPTFLGNCPQNLMVVCNTEFHAFLKFHTNTCITFLNLLTKWWVSDLS